METQFSHATIWLLVLLQMIHDRITYKSTVNIKIYISIADSVGFK